MIFFVCVTVTTRSFGSTVVVKVFFHCYLNSVLIIALRTFSVTVQKGYDADDIVK